MTRFSERVQGVSKIISEGLNELESFDLAFFLSRFLCWHFDIFLLDGKLLLTSSRGGGGEGGGIDKTGTTLVKPHRPELK